MQQIMYAVMIVIIVIVLYNLATWNCNSYEDYLYGFWVAEGDEFCETAEIDSMLVFIGEPDRGWVSQTRTCYIIIMNDLCNQGFKLTYRCGWTGIGVGKYCVRADVEFDEEDIWPETVSVTVDMRDGTMKIHSGDTVYARLHKQHDTTNSCRQLEDAELVDM
jgi:hypothetical protein